MISLIIPTTSKNKNYTYSILENIRELYPDESKVEVIIEIKFAGYIYIYQLLYVTNITTHRKIISIID
jgi:hypothetical protein